MVELSRLLDYLVGDNASAILQCLAWHAVVGRAHLPEFRFLFELACSWPPPPTVMTVFEFRIVSFWRDIIVFSMRMSCKAYLIQAGLRISLCATVINKHL
jgi:hypothetical protein